MKPNNHKAEKSQNIKPHKTKTNYEAEKLQSCIKQFIHWRTPAEIGSLQLPLDSKMFHFKNIDKKEVCPFFLSLNASH